VLTTLNQNALYWKIPLTYCVPLIVATFGKGRKVAEVAISATLASKLLADAYNFPSPLGLGILHAAAIQLASRCGVLAVDFIHPGPVELLLPFSGSPHLSRNRVTGLKPEKRELGRSDVDIPTAAVDDRGEEGGVPKLGYHKDDRGR
jgi:hypothetical protein